jgi:hypothetical protein
MNVLLDEYITIINNEDITAKQPETINIQLKQHQLKMLNKCLELENKKIKINNSIIKSSIGVIADPVGSGKSYVILGLFSNPYIKNKKKELLYRSNLFSLYNNIENEYIYKNINILIIPHNIFHQWKEYIKNTTLQVKYIKIKKDLEKIKFDNENLILVSSSIYNQFATLVNNNKYKFSRVVYDEADSIKIPACKEIKANFYWFVTSSVQNLLMPNGTYFFRQYDSNIITGINHTGFIKNTFIKLYNSVEHYYVKYIYLKNSDELIKESLLIPDPIIYKIICKNPKILNILNNIISNQIQRMINAGDIQNALKEIDIQRSNEQNLIKLVANDIINELENKKIDLESIQKKYYKDINKKNKDIEEINKEIKLLEDKINDINNRLNNNNIDPITYEEIKNKVIINCCKQSFDFESITIYITQINNPKCPMCRTNITKENLIIIDNNYLEDKEYIIEEKNYNKEQQLDLILLNKIKEDSRIIIFSEYNNTFEIIKTLLNKNKLEYKEVKGSADVIKNILSWYKDSEKSKKILLLNAKYYGSGLNLENTTDIILYHKMDKELEKQVIGRAQRFGRTSSLNIWELLYENE